jgi:hypothetical protein
VGRVSSIAPGPVRDRRREIRKHLAPIMHRGVKPRRAVAAGTPHRQAAPVRHLLVPPSIAEAHAPGLSRAASPRRDEWLQSPHHDHARRLQPSTTRRRCRPRGRRRRCRGEPLYLRQRSRARRHVTGPAPRWREPHPGLRAWPGQRCSAESRDPGLLRVPVGVLSSEQPEKDPPVRQAPRHTLTLWSRVGSLLCSARAF